jgi:carbamoyl-phosphate synthase small subunit
VFLSNGPADPAAVVYAHETVRGLLGRTPIFGICLGHQILGLALGGETYKLTFGHHGANHPVIDVRTSRVEITSQNHGFAVDQGLRGKGVAFFSVQYHPEASPGPHDAGYLFTRFRQLVEAFPRYGSDALDRIDPAEQTVESRK